MAFLVAVRTAWILSLVMASACGFVPHHSSYSTTLPPIHPTLHKDFYAGPAARTKVVLTANNNKHDDVEKPSIMDIVKEKPATLIIAPFAILIGLDLVLNILVLAKRTIEYVALGKAPSTEVWFSGDFFL